MVVDPDGRKDVGTAQDARMCSRRIASLLDTNFANLPVETLAAPTISTGRSVRGPDAAISSKSINLLSNPNIASDSHDCTIGEDGLIEMPATCRC